MPEQQLRLIPNNPEKHTFYDILFFCKKLTEIVLLYVVNICLYKSSNCQYNPMYILWEGHMSLNYV